MIITALAIASIAWFYFDRKDAEKSEEIIKREKQDNIRDYCLTVINSCKTHEQLHAANKLAKNCVHKQYINVDDYLKLIKQIWSKHNAIH